MFARLLASLVPSVETLSKLYRLPFSVRSNFHLSSKKEFFFSSHFSTRIFPSYVERGILSNGSTERRRSVGYGARRRRGGGYFRFSIEAVSNGTKLTQANFPFIEAAWSNWTLLGKVRPPFGEIIRRDIQTNEAPKTGFPATRCFCRSLRQPAGRLRDKSTRKSVVIGAGVPWHPTWWVTQVQQRLCSPSPLFSLPLSFSLSLSVYRVLFSIDDAGKYIR